MPRRQLGAEAVSRTIQNAILPTPAGTHCHLQTPAGEHVGLLRLPTAGEKAGALGCRVLHLGLPGFIANNKKLFLAFVRGPHPLGPCAYYITFPQAAGATDRAASSSPMTSPRTLRRAAAETRQPTASPSPSRRSTRGSGTPAPIDAAAPSSESPTRKRRRTSVRGSPATNGTLAQVRSLRPPSPTKKGS